MATFTNPLRAKVGPVATQNIFNDHAARIEEIQAAIADIPGVDPLNGEDTNFRAIRDGQLVEYIIKATLAKTYEQA